MRRSRHGDRRRPSPRLGPAPGGLPVAHGRARGHPTAFSPADLAPSLAAAGVDATVLVQTRSSLDETRELLATAAATPFIRGVVGWVDLTDPGIADTIAGLRAGPGGDRLVGIRHQVHDEPDPEWLLREDVGRGIRAVGEAGLVYDLLVRTRELPAALALARRPTRDTVRDRPHRQAADPRPRHGTVGRADPPVRRPGQRRVQGLGDGHRGRLGRVAAIGSRPVRRPRPRGLRTGATAVRLRLAGVPARCALRARVRGRRARRWTASGTPTSRRSWAGRRPRSTASADRPAASGPTGAASTGPGP